MKTLPEHFPGIHEWLHKHPRRTAVLATIGLLLAATLICVAAFYRAPVKTATQGSQGVTKTPVKNQPAYYSPLDGSKMNNQADSTLPVTAIMIENSPDARPQSGLKQAQVVYEAIAEGGITRFMALYQQNKPGLVGPVRSLRPYYIDWAAPYQAAIGHFGGSQNALEQVASNELRNLDFMAVGGSWRVNDRAAPHNVYTNFKNIDALQDSLGYKQSTFTSFARQDGAATKQPTATSVNIFFGSATYNTHYDYVASNNTYIRAVGGSAHADREDGQLTPSVVVAIKVDMGKVLEDGWRENIATSGIGSAVVFQNGTATECTWRKNSRFEPMQLIDANGDQIKLVRGQTWIAAIPSSNGSITWE